MFAIEEQGVIFDAGRQPPAGRIAFFTSLCVLRSGSVLCGFQNGPGKHAPTSTIRLCRSVDGGRTWELLPTNFATELGGVPGSLAVAEMVEASPNRLLLFATWFDRRDPDRPLFDPATEGILKSKQLLAISADEGRTWSEWRELDVGGLRGCSLTGPALRWPDGAVAFAFESFKEFDDPGPKRHAAWLVVSAMAASRFRGRCWWPSIRGRRSTIGISGFAPARTDGEFVAMFWTHDLVRKRDLSVHLRCGTIAADTISVDPILATPIPGQIAAPCLLRDGRLVAFVVDRGRPSTMTLWCSRDGGTSWPAAERLVVYTHDEQAALLQEGNEVDFAQYWEDMGRWSFGHPAVRLLGDGRLLLAWYAGTPDCMSLHWARVGID